MKQVELLTPQGWVDYELIDSGEFEKLERFGNYVVARPEPQAIWSRSLEHKEWERRADAYFRRDKSSDERGEWICKPSMPGQWWINYVNGDMKLRMRLGLTSFKHVGIFPEQAENWNFIYHRIKQIYASTKEVADGGVMTSLKKEVAAKASATYVKGYDDSQNESAAQQNTSISPQNRDKSAPVKVLNLFAYTGGATLAACSAGAEVTHVDSVKQVVSWSRENMEASSLDGVRWIVDDALKFVRREVKRGKKYHGIILDPPAYGRGPDGERWILEENITELLALCSQLLELKDSFLVLNLYSMGLSALLARTAVRQSAGEFDNEQFGELYFDDNNAKSLPLGVYYRCWR